MTNTLEIQQFSLWERITSKRVPLSFDLEVTARCNLNCRHCYINLPVGDSQARAGELTAAEILHIARQAVDLGAVWCLITGGEPLLREDFAEVYLGLKRLGLLVSVFTNGTLIRERHVALFKKYPPRDLELTVYGVSEETYEAVTRQPGSYKQFVRGLDLLLHADVPFRLKAMAIQTNYHEQSAIAEFCRQRTKDFFRFDPQLHLRYDRNRERNSVIRAERLTPLQVVTLEEADSKRLQVMRENCDQLILETLTPSENDCLFQCGAGVGSFTVSYDGLFRLCPSLWAEGTTCDLKTMSLLEAWRDFVPKVRNLKAGSEESLFICRNCALRNLCLWCPAHAHLETGSLEGITTYFCEIAKKRVAVVTVG